MSQGSMVVRTTRVPSTIDPRLREPLVPNDLGERLARLIAMGAGAFGADILVAEGHRGPDQAFRGDAEQLLDPVPPGTLEPADRRAEVVGVSRELQPLAEKALVERLLL